MRRRLGSIRRRAAQVPPVARARAAWSRLAYRRIQRRLAGPALLEGFADAYPDVFFIEIGSNDGEQHDHLRPLILRHRWRGIMVEPVPYVFERLKRNYEGIEGLEFENVAIADRDGELPFFHLREASGESTEVPYWYHGLGSFSRDAVLGHSHAIPDIEARLIETKVPSLTFDSLCERHSLSGFDLLLIDTEGYDWEILKNVDLDLHRPRLIVYEHFHLGHEDRAAARDYLQGHDYETMEEGFDTFCLDGRVEDRLAELWHRLRPAVSGVSVHDER